MFLRQQERKEIFKCFESNFCEELLGSLSLRLEKKKKSTKKRKKKVCFSSVSVPSFSSSLLKTKTERTREGEREGERKHSVTGSTFLFPIFNLDHIHFDVIYTSFLLHHTFTRFKQFKFGILINPIFARFV